MIRFQIPIHLLIFFYSKFQKIYSIVVRNFRKETNRKSVPARKGSVYFSYTQKDNKPNKLCSRRPCGNKGRNRDFRKFVLIVSIRSGTNKTFLCGDFPGNFLYTLFHVSAFATYG